jgi:hypothetical protein
MVPRHRRDRRRMRDGEDIDAADARARAPARRRPPASKRAPSGSGRRDPRRQDRPLPRSTSAASPCPTSGKGPGPGGRRNAARVPEEDVAPATTARATCGRSPPAGRRQAGSAKASARHPADSASVRRGVGSAAQGRRASATAAAFEPATAIAATRRRRAASGSERGRNAPAASRNGTATLPERGTTIRFARGATREIRPKTFAWIGAVASVTPRVIAIDVPVHRAGEDRARERTPSLRDGRRGAMARQARTSQAADRKESCADLEQAGGPGEGEAPGGQEERRHGVAPAPRDRRPRERARHGCRAESGRLAAREQGVRPRGGHAPRERPPAPVAAGGQERRVPEERPQHPRGKERDERHVKTRHREHVRHAARRRRHRWRDLPARRGAGLDTPASPEALRRMKAERRARRASGPAPGHAASQRTIRGPDRPPRVGYPSRASMRGTSAHPGLR